MSFVLAATSAASLTTLAMSAPLNPGVSAASLSLKWLIGASSLIFCRCTWKI